MAEFVSRGTHPPHRSALGHRHPADGRDAPGHGRGRGRRRRLRRGPDDHRARGAGGRPPRPRGRALRAVRDDGQPDRSAAGLRAGPGSALRRRRARRHLRDGRCGGDLRHLDAHGGVVGRPAGRRSADRAGAAEGRLAPDRHGRRRRRELAQPRRRARAAAERAPQALGLVAGVRRRHPPRRRPDLERGQSPQAWSSRPTGGWPTPRRSACPRGWARRSARCCSPRRSGSRPRGCGASGSAAGCARPACWPRPGCTPSTTTSSGWPRTTSTRSCWPSGSASTRRPSRPTWSCWTTSPRPWSPRRAKAQGVLVSQVSPRRIRLVLHLDVDRAAVDRAADVLAELL